MTPDKIIPFGTYGLSREGWICQPCLDKQEEILRLRAALELYADRDNWVNAWGECDAPGTTQALWIGVAGGHGWEPAKKALASPLTTSAVNQKEQ
jgi:hypothetical protein